MAELQGDGPGEPAPDGQTVDVRVPMEFKVRGGRKEIVLPPDAHAAPDVGPPRPIVVALARAYKWQEMLDSGKASSLDEIAQRWDVDRSYAGRITKLTSLAPRVVQALLAGEASGSISLNVLLRNLPLEWDRQLPFVDLPEGLKA